MNENKMCGLVRFENPRLKSKKIGMKSITFDYGECDGIDPYPLTFSTWREANGWIYAMSRGNVVYYKTWFTIEYENGRKYNSRYEIQGKLSDHQEIADLGAHVRNELLIGSGRMKTKTNHVLTKSEQEICEDLSDHYEIRAYTL